MVISGELQSKTQTFSVEYHDAPDFDALPNAQCTQAYGVCFYHNAIILAKTIKSAWILPGGTIEPGETYEQALIREIYEESNMNVLEYKPIGYQKVWNEHTNPIYQLRYYCKVEPYGPFERDLAEVGGNIASIWQIVPDQAASLLDWGAIGDRIIDRAIELHQIAKG